MPDSTSHNSLLLELSLSPSERQMLAELRSSLPDLHQRPATLLPYPYRLRAEPEKLESWSEQLDAFEQKKVIHFIFPGTQDQHIAPLVSRDEGYLIVYPVSLWLLHKESMID